MSIEPLYISSLENNVLRIFSARLGGRLQLELEKRGFEVQKLDYSLLAAILVSNGPSVAWGRVSKSCAANRNAS